jgi:hypothetical protein
MKITFKLKTIGVYRIRYLPNGAAYVGSSKRCIANRIGWHLCQLRAGRHQPRFQEEWDSSIESDWIVEILEECPPDLCREQELHWVMQEETPLNEVVGKRQYSTETKEKLKASARRISDDPEEKERRRQRALQQHAKKNFGAHTWVEGPDFSKIPGNPEALKRHIAKQSPEEMRRRSLMRKNIKRSV